MIQAYYRRLGPVPALVFWFDDLTVPVKKRTNWQLVDGFPWKLEAPLVHDFLIRRFGGRALWILADPNRDAFIGDDADTKLIVDADRDTGMINIGRADAATPQYLTDFTSQTGFWWDGWLILSGQHDVSALTSIQKQWFDSATSNHFPEDGPMNEVPAEAFYTFGDGTNMIWVPPMPLDEAIPLLYPTGEAVDITS